MYLNELHPENKDLFLDLCICLSMSDLHFSHEEKVLIKQLCAEMNIPERYSTDLNVNDVIKSLAKNTTEREKRIIIIEAAGIIMVDNDYSDNEKKLMLTLSKIFGIPYSETEKIIGTISELYSVYEKFAQFLTGKSI